VKKLRSTVSVSSETMEKIKLKPHIFNSLSNILSVTFSLRGKKYCVLGVRKGKLY
jgi:hypothetical protein